MVANLISKRVLSQFIIRHMNQILLSMKLDAMFARCFCKSFRFKLPYLFAYKSTPLIVRPQFRRHWLQLRKWLWGESVITIVSQTLNFACPKSMLTYSKISIVYTCFMSASNYAKVPPFPLKSISAFILHMGVGLLQKNLPRYVLPQRSCQTFQGLASTHYCLICE